MLASGTILIERDAPRPRCFELRDGSPVNAWMPVTHNFTPHELEKELSSTGWTFFFMAGAIRSTAFGFDRVRTTDKALKRLIANVERQKCNCLQIDEVAMHSFLGLPYVSVSAHSRHIQKGMIFSGR